MKGIKIVVIGLIFTFLFGLTGAMASDVEAAKKEREVNFYCSIDSKTAEKLGALFTEKYGIKVNVFRSGTGKVISKIEAELRAGKVLVDVVQHSDPSTFVDWKARNLLRKYTPENPERFYDFTLDPDGFYVAIKNNTTIIAYNPTLVKKEDAPWSWKDVLDPKWKGKLCMSNPYYAGSTRMWTSCIVKMYGWDYFKELAKNSPYIGRSHSGLRTMCISGESPVIAEMNSYHVFQVLYEKPETPIAVTYPQDGAIFITGPAGIFKNSPHPNAAKLFMDFLCDEEAQRLIAERAYYPALKGIYLSAQPRLEDMKLLMPDYKWVLEHTAELCETFDKIMGRK